MKKLVILYILLLTVSGSLVAQVSHGGKPLPLSLATRSVSLFREMPRFDVQEQLRIDSLDESDLRSGYRFAYKFITDFDRNNSGQSFTLPDGTTVWRLGIRSAGAYSINILFSEYELPEGAQLFLYNPSQTQVLGSFNYLNNSETEILPTAPVGGDELIIEYQEPPNVSFHGRLKVGEVNHAYRSFKGDEPSPISPAFGCLSPLVCFQSGTDQYKDIGRSVVLMLIDGTIACTGTLVNNTQNDGKPYLLTASHCLNGQFSVTNPDYNVVAGSIVFFFNYDSPLCSPVLRGAEEMSVASARFRAVNEQTDMALLELLETPPAYYQPYYAGWNARDGGTPPYIGIHHPGGSVKYVNTLDHAITPETYRIPFLTFADKSHWLVDEWTTGCTFGGSSGSALFDSDNRVVGALSGGRSNCYSPVEDFYYALNKSWVASPNIKEQLKAWLNPLGNNTLVCDGFDPYKSAPCLRMSNVRESGKAEKVQTTLLPLVKAGPLFGNNLLGITEYVESYKVTGRAKVYGAYLVTPRVENAKDMKVQVVVYGGIDKPETLLHSESFEPSYTNLDKDKTFIETTKPLNRDQETFVAFSEPVDVSGTFYIGYNIKASTDATYFSAFNLPKGEVARNTTWLNYKNQWIEASSHPLLPMNTSLFVDPVIQYITDVSNESIDLENPIRIFVGTERRTIHILIPDNIDNAVCRLISAEGKNVQDMSVMTGQNTVTIPALAPGMYLVQIRYDNKCYTQKVIF